jgi:hypothetical protein
MNSSWVIIGMAPSSPSVLGSTSRLEGPLTRPVDAGQEEHDLSYEREFR